MRKRPSSRATLRRARWVIAQVSWVGLLASPAAAQPKSSSQTASPDRSEQRAETSVPDATPSDAATESGPSEEETAPTQPGPEAGTENSNRAPPTSDAPPPSSASSNAAVADDGRALDDGAHPSADGQLERLWRLTDQTLADGAEDLAIDVTFSPPTSGHTDERSLLASSKRGWSLAAQLTRTSGGLQLRLSAVAPGERLLRVMVENVTDETLVVTLLKMLRDLQKTVRGPEHPGPPPMQTAPAPPRESDGRAYLAVTGALVGGYVGFSLEHIAGSSDTRLIYPLMTLGAGVGVGASLVAADEWQVTTGEAWYLSATTLWSTTSALLIADGANLEHASHRHAYGLLGAAAGLSLGTVAISTAEVGQGGALLTHSGAVFGGLFGALTERLAEADIEERPSLGLGTGLAVGTLVAGFVATQVPDPSPTRLVYVDLSAFLGGLTGAAGASPVLVGDAVTATETRIWVGSVLAGTILGGVLGYALTTDVDGGADDASSRHVAPMLTQLDFGQPWGPRPWALGVTGEW